VLKGPGSLERLIWFGTFLFIAGCGSGEGSRSAEVESSDDSETVGSDGLMGVEWRLVVLQMDGGAPMTPDAEAIPTITFLDEATPTGFMRFGGSGGCNRFNGAYDVGDDGSLSMSQDVAMTRMACPEAIMRLEQGLMMAFAETTSYEIDGDGLSVTFGGGTIRFTAGP
jgi:heat shock protein HslJ